jgi:mannan endo-1,4-beta-mannosidase
MNKKPNSPNGSVGSRNFLGMAGLLSLFVGLQLTDARPAQAATGNEFVKQASNKLKLNGKNFRFAGANNYYIAYKSQASVDNVLSAAAAHGFTVVRTWGSLDTSSAANAIGNKGDGVVYFQSFDGTAPVYNDGADGLKHLDYVIYKAGQLGLKVVLPLVNNWKDFGGMDQYVQWAGGQYHDDFYTSTKIRSWYKNWISHLLNHVNSYSNVAFKDDPTIMTWELGNEPRCQGSGTANNAYPTSANCSTQVITSWADDVSRFIKQTDNKHLVSVGDEGFYCDPASTDWLSNCYTGIDTLALTQLTKIDVMSYHLYPSPWGETAAWGTQWIEEHIADSLALNKPAMLGEYGWVDKSTRDPNYKAWTDAVRDSGGSGALFWMLADVVETGSPYPDWDGYNVYCPSPGCQLLTNFAATMASSTTLQFAPVADNDAAVTPYNVPATVNVLGNDVAYNGATLAATTVDLDPTAGGVQTALTTAAGTFSANVNGTVIFTSVDGFSGNAQASYVVTDSLGRASNAANITVTVKPKTIPDGVIVSSFESGLDGWRSVNGSATLTTTTAYRSDGLHSLQVDGSDWIGWQSGNAFDLTANPILRWDVSTTGGTSKNVVVQSGDNWTWCQGSNWDWINAGNTTTEVDLRTLGCADLTKVHAVYIFVGGGASPYYIDYVRLIKVPPPVTSTVLASFEDGTDNFVGPGWGEAGTVTQSTLYPTDGIDSLKVNVTAEGWFGITYGSGISLAGRTSLKWNVYVDSSSAGGTNIMADISTGSGWNNCSPPWNMWVNQGSSASATVNFANLTCDNGSFDPTQVHRVLLYFKPGTYYIDYLRAE